MPTTQIKDPVHGYVELPDALVEGVVDTRPFQRLRYVRQLSATHLVYPGANHTRFEHSLGVYHLGRTVFENLRQQSYFAREATVDELEEIQRTLECACLLHDVGHPPFSHLSEGFLDEGILRERVAETGLVDAFDAAGVGGAPAPLGEPARTARLRDYRRGVRRRAPGVRCRPLRGVRVRARLQPRVRTRRTVAVRGRRPAAPLPIDVDRLDYITRDNYMTGAGVLSFDVDRMVDAYTAHPEEGLALTEKALSTIGNYLEGRIALYMWVTQHHKSVYANRLLQAMLGEYAAETGESPVTVNGVLSRELDDNAVLERLRIAARDRPDSTLASMYDRFRGGASRPPAGNTGSRSPTGWAETSTATSAGTAAKPSTSSRRGSPRATTGWNDSSPTPSTCRSTRCGSTGRTCRPTTPTNWRTSPHRVRRTTRSVGDWGLYGDRAFDVPIPFVFVPDGTKRRAIRVLTEAFEREVGETKQA